MHHVTALQDESREHFSEFRTDSRTRTTLHPQKKRPIEYALGKISELLQTSEYCTLLIPHHSQ